MIEKETKIVFWYTMIFALLQIYSTMTVNEQAISENILKTISYVIIGVSLIQILLAVLVLIGSYHMYNIRGLLIALLVIYSATALYVLVSSFMAWNFVLFVRAVIITIICLIPIIFIKKSFDVII